jgi:hypothetical protein
MTRELLSNDATNSEPLMAAIGRIAVRSADLGEMVDLVIRRLDTTAVKKARTMMLGNKVKFAKDIATQKLTSAPHLRDDFVEILRTYHLDFERTE